MSKLLDMLNDEALDFTVKITDTDGVTAEYEFLDIVLYKKNEYAVLLPSDDDENVDIFKIIPDGKNEKYARVTDDETLDAVFDIFRVKNEDEFDF
ncbi:MAG: DUF1292 domain-containing protein [Clostridia bacterium]|nr:DUF1292 domain-containing protein [Clostridia bacterium]